MAVTGFLYSVLLKLLYPTSVALALLVAALLAHRRRALSRALLALGIAVLLAGGNGWVVHTLVSSLERRHPGPTPLPTADAVVVLAGGIHAQIPPRPTVEVSESGDRVLYAAELYRRGLAPVVIATGNVGTGAVGRRPEAEDMADLLTMVGVPRAAVVLEVRSQNTREHTVQLCPMFAARGIHRVLLVTTAMHMPRSLAVFRHGCPAVDYVPAPTDFRFTDGDPEPWYRLALNLLPTPGSLLDFSAAAHEHLGLLYYRMRGWI